MRECAGRSIFPIIWIFWQASLSHPASLCSRFVRCCDEAFLKLAGNVNGLEPARCMISQYGTESL